MKHKPTSPSPGSQTLTFLGILEASVSQSQLSFKGLEKQIQLQMGLNVSWGDCSPFSNLSLQGAGMGVELFH